ncbi:MAG: hypothetical protein AAF805_03620 [Planctomycetota bacterium]
MTEAAGETTGSGLWGRARHGPCPPIRTGLACGMTTFFLFLALTPFAFARGLGDSDAWWTFGRGLLVGVLVAPLNAIWLGGLMALWAAFSAAVYNAMIDLHLARFVVRRESD